ncbi:MAG: thioredoxin-dependent thiol peroxidase [Arenimonas sp.]
MLNVGDAIPDFHLNNEEGKTISNAGLEGQRFVLYFYPKDDTPGCTKEACSFRDNLPAFDKIKVPVFGISADDEKAHGKFVSKYKLNFSLLADPDHATCDAFGTWVEKSMYGRKYFGIQRSTFIVSAKGKIEHVWEKVSPEGHAEEVLAFLNGKPLNKASKAAAPAKKAVAKKIAAKKAVVKKAAVKKASPKRAPAKKAISKAAVKKTPAKKAPAKKRKA